MTAITNSLLLEPAIRAKQATHAMAAETATTTANNHALSKSVIEPQHP